MGLVYRASQFIRALGAKPDPQMLARAEMHLPGGLKALFREQSSADVAHSLRVYQALLSEGETHPDLLSAALLHDIGKTLHPLSLWGRVLVVLGWWLLPSWAARWGEGRPTGWRRPFVVAVQHPRWGAEIIRSRGGTELLANIIRRHQMQVPEGGPDEGDALIRRLQAVDGRN